jgi:phospholipase C
VEKIDHLVVLMLENRSFDHMLGYLKNAGMNVEGKIGQMNETEDGRRVVGHHLDSTRVRIGAKHHVPDVARQVAGGKMDGFVKGYNSRHAIAELMGHYDERDLPSYDRLARRYVVCDHWHSSVPGPTWPNRFFAMCGTSDGIAHNGALIERPTFFDLLPEDSFCYYSHDIAFLRTVKRYTGYTGPRIEKFGAFCRACRKGKLPSVSWIDPNFTVYHVDALLNWANDDHPPADISRGQNLVARIYNELIASTCWPRTLFIIAYDEHGGFYDHVPPPRAEPPGEPPFDTYGVRVPAFVVSPWVPPGMVFKGTVDHTCIARTALERFAPSKVDALTPRVSASPSLLGLLTLKEPRRDATRLEGVPILESAIAPIRYVSTAPDKGAIDLATAASVSARFHTMELTENQEQIRRLQELALEEGASADSL